MKNISIISFTNNGTFIYVDGKNVREATFEGLNFDNSVVTRQILKPYLKKQIQCRFDKTMSKIRYNNFQFYESMLRLNAAKINPLQFQQTKIFNYQEKQKLQLASTQLLTDKIIEYSKKIVDYTYNRKDFAKLFAKVKKVQANLQYFSSQIYISFENQGLTNYVPIKLRNIDHYFQLVQRISFSDLFRQSKLYEVNFTSFKYNLAKKQYEIDAVLPEQIEKKILSEGWGVTSLKNLNSIKPELFSQFKKQQQKAKTAHKGIHAKPFQILSLVYTKNNLVALVEQIIQGYIFKIRTKNDELIKIQLAKIYCPISNEAGAFSCRQFSRKNLIGKQVNVFLTKDQGLNILGSLVRFSDNKDIQSLMIENGYGFVKEELKGTMFYAKLQTLERKARELRRGIHNQKNVGYQFYEDFTVSHSKKEKLDKRNAIESKQHYLRQIQAGDEGVIDKCIDPVTYIVRIDAHKKLIKVKLDGISKIFANPRLPEVIQLQKKSEAYIQRHFYQRTVTLQLIEYNQESNNFIGIIRHTGKGKDKLSFQESLLSQGLACLVDNGIEQQKWLQCEKLAQSRCLGCWKQNLRHFVRKNIFDEQKHEFMGKFSWVEDGQLACVQPHSVNQRLDLVYQMLSNKQELKALIKEDLVPGCVCAAEYQGQMYRARIVSIQTKSQAVVKFIDWGNKQTVNTAQLKQLPNKLQYLPPLCCEVLLNLVKPLKTRDPQHLQKLRQYLMEGDCKFIKVFGNTVDVYMGANHINTSLIYEGFLKADLSKIPDQTSKKHMIEQMNKLRGELVGVWDLDDQEEQYEKDYGYD